MPTTAPGVRYTDKRTQSLGNPDLTSASWTVLDDLAESPFNIPSDYWADGEYLALLECDFNPLIVTSAGTFAVEVHQVDSRNPAFDSADPAVIGGTATSAAPLAAGIKVFQMYAVPADGVLAPTLRAKRLTGTGALRTTITAPSALWTVTIVPAGIQ